MIRFTWHKSFQEYNDRSLIIDGAPLPSSGEGIDDDVEEALEADERLVFDPSDGHDRDNDDDSFAVGRDERDDDHVGGLGEEEIKDASEAIQSFLWKAAAVPVIVVLFMQVGSHFPKELELLQYIFN